MHSVHRGPLRWIDLAPELMVISRLAKSANEGDMPMDITRFRNNRASVCSTTALLTIFDHLDAGHMLKRTKGEQVESSLESAGVSKQC